MLILPAVALADSPPPPQHTLAFPTDQVWTLIIGALVPLVTYVLNYLGPQVDEKIKAFVLVVVAAIAGGLTQAVVAGDVGFNNTTLQFVLTAVVAALTAHAWLWRPSGTNVALGGGRNRQAEG
jgi:hypothetical protein